MNDLGLQLSPGRFAFLTEVTAKSNDISHPRMIFFEVQRGKGAVHRLDHRAACTAQ